jgi:L-ascorbate metabolism protein UlaG (beta-lactamase superfamily)
MKITFLAHASFLITTKDNTKIITDPYKAKCFSGALCYKPINESANIVLVSHQHDDHNGSSEISGSPKVIQNTGQWEIGNIKISGHGSYHDANKGKDRGNNIIFIIEADGIRIAHLGDLGHGLTQSDYKEMGKIDVLLMPVGGYFTINSKVATEIMNRISPKITIPMHYKTEGLDFPIAKVDEFLNEKKNVKKLNSSEVEITKDSALGGLPKAPEIWVLKMAKE